MILDELKYLGVYLAADGTNTAEVNARLAAAWKRWMCFTNVWFSNNLCLRMTRLFFQALVYNVLISALEAYVLSDAELDKLTCFVCKRARALLRGKAHKHDKDTGVHESWTNGQVLKACRLLPVHLELRLRRLKWLQCMVKHPQDAGAMLAAWFMQLDWDKDDKPNPWTLQLQADIDSLAPFGCDFSSDQDFQLQHVFSKWEYQKTIIDVDLTEVRATWLSKLETVFCRVGAGGEHDVKETRCDIEVEEGVRCDYIATSHANLIHHQVRSQLPNHGVRNMLRFIVVTNQCLFCSSVHANIQTTQQHVINSFRCMNCKIDRGYKQVAPVEPSSLCCPWSNVVDEQNRALCNFEASHLAELHQHIVAHLDWSPDIVYRIDYWTTSKSDTATIKVRDSVGSGRDHVQAPCPACSSHGRVAPSRKHSRSQQCASYCSTYRQHRARDLGKRAQSHDSHSTECHEQSPHASHDVALIFDASRNCRRSSKR